jgi:hypothetical protein
MQATEIWNSKFMIGRILFVLDKDSENVIDKTIGNRFMEGSGKNRMPCGA